MRDPDPSALAALVFKTILGPPCRQALALPRARAPSIRQPGAQHHAGGQGASAISAGSWARRRARRGARPRRDRRRGSQAQKDTLTGDTLSDEAHPVILPGIAFPEPAISFAIQPKSRGDEDKISTALHRMAEEDPTLHHHFDPDQTAPGLGHRSTPRRGRGGAHEAQVQRGRVTPAPAHSLQGDGEGARGGAGQVQEADGGAAIRGDTWLKIEPLARGGGFEFVDDIFGGAIRATSSPRWKRVRDCMKARHSRRVPSSTSGSRSTTAHTTTSTRPTWRFRSPRRWGCRRASWRRGRACSSRS